MSEKQYSLASDKAYAEKLKVLKAGQRWFSFDVPMADARKGVASRFGMTLWNFHCIDGTRDFEKWGITKDPVTGSFWYRVPKSRNGVTSNNRKSLWDALQIAATMPQPFQMQGILKDGKTHLCSPDHVFDIAEVHMQADGSRLWLKLNLHGQEVGTGFNEELLPPMHDIQGSGSATPTRSNVLPDEHYIAIRDAAVRVYLEGGVRVDELQALHHDYGINTGTASAIFNNFRCLIEGEGFKTPMRSFGLQLFVDAIVAMLGDDVVPKVIKAIEAYIGYAETKLKQGAPGFYEILSGLKQELVQATLLKKMTLVAESVPHSSSANSTDSTEPQPSAAASEILREVWVRGPQHAAFRRALLRRWSDKCSVHGVACNDQLRASHIVAWSLDEAIRGDVNNGLLLSVPLDNLFDRGLISFDDDGAIICSPRLTAETCTHFGVRPNLRLAWDHLSKREKVALRATLSRHRERHGF
ncbi:HNH endonuclease [Paucibacter sp. JuS9]|uniref:HNH endonuclease n=1 Tax=Paucibacter sp. JuS9 TaxID=3228748 RepID=UPI003757CB2C